MANNVEVRVPVPSDADSPKFKTSTGTAKYVPEKNMVVWTIKSFPVRNSQLCLLHVNILSMFLHVFLINFVWVCIHLSIQGGKEFLMRAHFGLPSVENNELEGKPPITVKFEIPYFTVSGIQVCVCLCYVSFNCQT